MPVVVVHGRDDGPTVWLSGAVHGDELNGVEIVRRLIHLVEAKRLAGTILAVPIVNVFGIMSGSRYLPDRRDLNRSFPGSKRGSLASRLARIFFDSVATRCELGLDFHTGSAGRSNLPQVRCDVDDPLTRRLAEAFHPDVILDASLRNGSLRAAACRRGGKVLLYEAGEAYRFDRWAIERGVEGALRVLNTMNMISDAPERSTPVAVSRKSEWLRAGRSGFCRVWVELGDEVERGQPVATIADSVSENGVDVRARVGGVVIGALRTALVHRGDALLHVARLES